MPTDVSLMLHALRKHRTICILIIIQITLACAVLGNGLNLVRQRYELQSLATGLAESQLFVLEVTAIQGRIDESQRAEVMASVGASPRVKSVAYVNALPFGERGGTYSFKGPDEVGSSIDAALYYGSVGYLRTLGVQILDGRDFVPADFQKSSDDPLGSVSSIILSESLSRRLGASVGSRVQVGTRDLTVVGIARDVMSPVLVSAGDVGNSAFVPSPPGGLLSTQIVINTGVGDSPTSAREITAAATLVTPKTLIWSAKPFSEIRDSYFAPDRSVIRLVLGLGVLLALVVAGGIGGLSSYWISRRHKQIAIRRALGARRRDIAWYFHLESLFVASAGALLGFISSIAVSVAITEWLALPSMPIVPLLWGGLIMLAVCQLAVIAPVRRAVSIAPAVLNVT